MGVTDFVSKIKRGEEKNCFRKLGARNCKDAQIQLPRTFLIV